MSPEQIFSLLTLVTLSGWLLLALLPRRRDVVAGKAIPALLAIAYIAILAVNLRGGSGGFSSLADVALLFSNPWLLLAGWTHYLAFDLFVGSWETRDAVERGLPRLLLLPCLVLTFLFGPAGWLLYMLLRTGYNRA